MKNHRKFNADKYEELLSQIDGFACIKRAGGEILYANDYAVKLFGLPPSEVVGRTDHDLWPETQAEEFVRRDLEVVGSAKPRRAVETLSIGDRNRTFLTHRFALRGAAKGEIGLFLLDVTDHLDAEEKLRQVTAERNKMQEELERKRIALHEVLAEVEKGRNELKENIATNVESVLLPLLDRLERQAGLKARSIIESLRTELGELASPFVSRLKGEYSGLSDREMEVCGLIRRGLSSKEIGENLNLSSATVFKYRELIRRKLGLTNQSVSLKTFLQRRDNPGYDIEER